jgi:hypothetical protein
VHSHDGTGKTHGRQTKRTFSGAVAAKNQVQSTSSEESAGEVAEPPGPPHNDDLGRLIVAWGSLSEADRAAILAILDAAEQPEASR